MNKKAYKRYKMSVRSLLPCGRKQKDRIMESFSESLDAYQSENPDASYEEITAHFGTPDEIAATCVENTGTADLLRMLRIRKRIIAIVAGAITAAFLMWAAVLAVNSILLYPEERGYFIVTMEELPNGTVVEDESITIEDAGQ